LDCLKGVVKKGLKLGVVTFVIAYCNLGKLIRLWLLLKLT